MIFVGSERRGSGRSEWRQRRVKKVAERESKVLNEGANEKGPKEMKKKQQQQRGVGLIWALCERCGGAMVGSAAGGGGGIAETASRGSESSRMFWSGIVLRGFTFISILITRSLILTAEIWNTISYCANRPHLTFFSFSFCFSHSFLLTLIRPFSALVHALARTLNLL